MEESYFANGLPINHTRRNIDHILQGWLYEPNGITARQIRGADGRSLLQMRIEMGVIQMETHFRPDGARPGGFKTYLRKLKHAAARSEGFFTLSCPQYFELVRELKQYDYRRVCWFALKKHNAMIRDAEHGLAILDFIREYAPISQMNIAQEENRPFLMFHRIYGLTMQILRNSSPQNALRELAIGIRTLKETIYDLSELFAREPEKESQQFVSQLLELKKSIQSEHNIIVTLEEELDNAISEEDYEKAAKIRDKISKSEFDFR